MRADQEVWVVQATDGAVVGVDPSFKNLLHSNGLQDLVDYRDALAETKAKLTVLFEKDGVEYGIFRMKMQKPITWIVSEAVEETA